MDEEFSELFSDALIHQFVEQRMKVGTFQIAGISI